MANKRLQVLPFLPPIPFDHPAKQYQEGFNRAVNAMYRTIAASVDGMVITGTNSTQFPAAQGFKRFGFASNQLYLDWDTTSWTPVGGTSAQTQSSLLLPEGFAFPGNISSGLGAGAGVPTYLPFFLDNQLSASSLDFFYARSQATLNGSSQAHSISIRAGLYNQADPLILQSSSSTSYAWTVTNSTLGGTGIQRLVLPWTVAPGAGSWVLGAWSSSSSSGNALGYTLSQIGMSSNLSFQGDMTQAATASSNQMLRFYAAGSVSTAALLSSVSASTLNGASLFIPTAYFRAGATV